MSSQDRDRSAKYIDLVVHDLRAKVSSFQQELINIKDDHKSQINDYEAQLNHLKHLKAADLEKYQNLEHENMLLRDEQSDSTKVLSELASTKVALHSTQIEKTTMEADFHKTAVSMAKLNNENDMLTLRLQAMEKESARMIRERRDRTSAIKLHDQGLLEEGGTLASLANRYSTESVVVGVFGQI